MTPGTAPTVDDVRLRRLLGAPGLSWLVDRARRRLERGQPLTGPVSLSAPSSDQRMAAERLLGRAPGGGRSLSVRLEAVDDLLRRSGISPAGLTTAVVALTGPVTLLGQARAEEERAWAQAYAPLDALADEVPALRPWAERLRGDGLVRRLAGTPTAAADLLGQVATVVRALPAEPAMLLPAFASRLLGSAHARFRYHGDFDWGGLRIAGALLRRVPWTPWRYTAADYRTAVCNLPSGPPLTGVRAEAPWDPDLSDALQEAGVRVEEEAVLGDLLSDLG
ncbi:TIGR02679 domain-containing protein [Streptomyces sp. wa1064]|uniref:TIGR02679 domain-containing protein n=1 Tax=Streptomyces sp. wa1064 TaxID=1828213 RepID=UPI003C79FB4B